MQTNCFHCGRDDAPHPRPQPKFDVPITAAEVKKIFSDCDDFEMRTVRIGLESRLTVCVCWLDGVVAAGDVSADILRPLTEGGRLADVTGSREAVRRIEQGAVYSCATRTRTQMDALVADLTTGSAALIFDAQRKAVTFEARTANVRAVSEPTIEKSVSGAKDAFVETLRINTSLVRRRLHTPEDEAHNYLLASALIVLRYFALALSLTFPALYVAVAMYHQEMIPAKLLLSVIQAKQQVPFSVPAIILFMLIAFELLQEAGLRLPNSIGQTVSIIGALLVGQSAVDAKIVSPVAIIVVALAGIAGYTLPNQELSNAVRLLRLALVLAATLAGLFGILAMLGLVIWYLCTIDSDGVAYMAPFVDSERPALWRTLLRRPQPDNKFRPPEYGSENRRRQR